MQNLMLGIPSGAIFYRLWLKNILDLPYHKGLLWWRGVQEGPGWAQEGLLEGHFGPGAGFGKIRCAFWGRLGPPWENQISLFGPKTRRGPLGQGQGWPPGGPGRAGAGSSKPKAAGELGGLDHANPIFL